MVDVLLWGLLYWLFLRTPKGGSYRLLIISALVVAGLSYLFSPLFSPMRDLFGPSPLIPLLWMGVHTFRRVHEACWISPFLLLLGVFNLMVGRMPIGVLGVAVSPIPLLIRYVRLPDLNRTSKEGEVAGMEEKTPPPPIPEEVEEVPPPVIPRDEEGGGEPPPGDPQHPPPDKTDGEVESTKKAILSKLLEFGIKGEIVKVWRGPVLTLYEFVPAPGVKVSSVVSRADDLHISLKKPVRIVAPLPSGNIGIEVPNDRREVFTFKDAEAHLSKGGVLTVPIGVDVFGRPYSVHVHKAPHILIGGATGSGKSVLLLTVISGLIRKNTPETLRLVLIDPKMVELSVFEGVPHLLMPVAKMVPHAVHALKKLVEIMTERYTLMSSVGAKDIETYNAKAKRLKMESMPYITVIIDELADLIMQAPKDTVEAIQRIAQMARAVGIHMIVATQRPSVDVIKPVIKANFPTRIALKVASRFDSRTILDREGAERLLGKGDMLIITPESSQPVRVHGYYTSPEDVRSLVLSWISFNLSKLWGVPYAKSQMFVKEADEEGVLTALFREDEPAHTVRLERLMGIYERVFGPRENLREFLMRTVKDYYPFGFEDDEEKAGEVSLTKLDPLVLKAARIFEETGYASVSLLQRRMGVGYPRAAKIVDQLERLGFISKSEGVPSRPRKILMSVNELRKLLGK